MKKLTRKLFLSVAALAVCAATLVSTTFAWYVSNSEASVSEIHGSTAGTEVSGNLLVAKNDTTGGSDAPGAFTQNLKLDFTGEALAPVTKGTDTNEGKWVDKAGEVNTVGANTMELKFWIMSTKAQTVNATYTITNTTAEANVKTQKAYTSTGAPVTQNTEFAMDAINALRMQVVTTEATAQDKTLDVAETAEIGTATYAGFTAPTADSDANIYYYQLLGQVPHGCTAATGASPAAPTDTWTQVTLAADTPVMITITIWLEGTDKDCFDSCINQSFDLQFDFEVAGA